MAVGHDHRPPGAERRPPPWPPTPVPTAEKAGPLLLPGFADTPDWKPIVGPGKTRPGPQARADVYGKPKPVVRNARGRLVAGRPLKADDLVGSRARFMVEGREPK